MAKTSVATFINQILSHCRPVLRHQWGTLGVKANGKLGDYQLPLEAYKHLSQLCCMAILRDLYALGR